MASSFLAYRLVQLLLETDFYLLSQILWLKKRVFLGRILQLRGSGWILIRKSGTYGVD